MQGPAEKSALKYAARTRTLWVAKRAVLLHGCGLEWVVAQTLEGDLQLSLSPGEQVRDHSVPWK